MSPRKLWQRRLADGSEVAATLFHDRTLNEATAEFAISGTHSEDVAVSFANAIRKAIDERGATPIEER
jgi:hypothetical protein